ncbi:sulfotransferase family protein [Chitinophaga nivalis]|uniref:Sulfotransferase n=1 Tax=Chitinophaga nivalis TaxID=2991709 RepID=A0ABT3II81_9BACT|nr:sulfotransferase [Chitinophaga nivalis]MCW3466648.1 sulfotransferase [Chitinophaga nivalis]MCW3483661.1 sulfotransferase [Chitinophaga nivalis]
MTDVNTQPIFIICHARSGSTLLRYILDTHEWVSCQPETEIGRLIKELYEVHTRLARGLTSLQHIPAVVAKSIRELRESYLRPPKIIWCDKSISNLTFLDLLQKSFPDARYIYLYRDCLDFIHSAFEIFNSNNAGSLFKKEIHSSGEAGSINALADLWCRNVERMMKFESDPAFHAIRVTHESIVRQPAATIQRLFDFLQLPVRNDFIENIFKINHQRGHGDPKIIWTNNIELNTVGKGYRIPIHRLHTDKIAAINQLQAALGFRPIDLTVNTAVPAHHRIGSNHPAIRQYTAGLLANIVQEFREILAEQSDQYPDAPPCILHIRDANEARYELSFHPPYVTNSTPASHIRDIISIDFHALLALLDNRTDFTSLQMKWEVFTEGSAKVLGPYLTLFL